MVDDGVLTRRTLLGAAAILTGTALATTSCTPPLEPTPPRLPAFPADPGIRRLFAPSEQVMGLYGATLPALTAAISRAQGRVGWMTGGYWRPAGDPTNSRTQENVSTLAWFYTQDRPWNPYYRSPELLGALESALSYYLSLQRDDGAFPEGPTQSPRAATGFALIYLSQTYLLMQTSTWDEQLERDLLERLLRAVDWFLDPANADVWQSAVYTSNQVVAGLLGAFMIAGELGPSRTRLLKERLRVFLEVSESPAGYLYEDRTVDFGYTIGVAVGDLALLNALVDDVRLVRVVARFLEFCSYNYLWEPDGSGFVVNGGLGSRQAVAFLDAERTDERSVIDLLGTLRKQVPLANAFLSTAEGRSSLRTAWAEDASPIPSLELGRVDPSRPRTVLAQPEFPSQRERMSALASFRYQAETDFVEKRYDPLSDQHYLWVRRPGYFTGVLWGERRGGQQSGLGFFFHPDTGTFVCAQSAPHLSWGALAAGQEDATTSLMGRFQAGQDQGDASLTLTTPDGARRRTLVYRPDRLEVTYETSSAFVEHVPLVLQPTDQISWHMGPRTRPLIALEGDSVDCLGLEVVRGRHRLMIELTSPATLTLTEVSASMFIGQSRSVRSLRIGATGRLAYDMRIDL